MMIGKKIFILLAVVSVIIGFSSCEEEGTPHAPDLPPQEAFTMDFSDFSNQKYATAKKSMPDEEPMAVYTNYTHAFLTLAGWNALVTITLSVPTFSYIAVLNTDPVYLGDNRWKWETPVNAGGMNTYSAKLITERISNEEFRAEMYITKNGTGGFEDFKWFEGVVRYDRTKATWTLYENPVKPGEIISIDWSKDWENETSSITYTNVNDGSKENGSFICFEISGETDFNAKYTVATSNKSIYIEWDRETKAGHVMDVEKFGDDLWHCWNSLLQDIDCSGYSE